MISRKFRFYPNQVQKAFFRKCFGTHRYFYNKAIQEINDRYNKKKQEYNEKKTCLHCDEPKEEASWMCKEHQTKKIPWNLDISLISLRKAIMKSDKEIKDTVDDWQREIPYDTRQLAIKDAVSAYKSCITNKVRGNIDNFSLRFLSRKKPSRIFWINDSALKTQNGKIQLFQRRLKEDGFLRFRKRVQRKLPTTIDHDSKIFYDRGAYYLILTIDPTKWYTNTPVHDIVSLDPGVRTFQTGYSPSGVCMKMGEDKLVKLHCLQKRIDHLKGIKDKTKQRKTKWHLRNRIRKLWRQSSMLIDDLHNQTCSRLILNFKTILLPSFGTSKMLSESTLHSKTKRDMSGLAHYRFKCKLETMCKRNGRILNIVDESYTTKTCGSCGNIHSNVGSDKIYKCLQCPYTLDRDLHGARNIYIKFRTGMTTHVPERSSNVQK